MLVFFLSVVLIFMGLGNKVEIILVVVILVSSWVIMMMMLWIVDKLLIRNRVSVMLGLKSLFVIW